jgi:hypothetical protein
MEYWANGLAQPPDDLAIADGVHDVQRHDLRLDVRERAGDGLQGAAAHLAGPLPCPGTAFIVAGIVNGALTAKEAGP